MSLDAICLSILILTEDSAGDAHETITALVKKMLGLVVQGCGTHRIDFEPQNALARRAMHGNLWKSNRPRDHQKLVDLRRTIATKLLEGSLADGAEVPGFVFFHVDGDRRWADRALSENVARFNDFVLTVRTLVADTLAKKERQDELDARMQRLRRLTPFYSIEAWLYQNTAEARRLCTAACGLHTDKINAWEADRGILDEIEKPKDELCLHDKHNLSLARSGFPAEDVLQASKSYDATVMDMLNSDELCAALKRTAA